MLSPTILYVGSLGHEESCFGPRNSSMADEDSVNVISEGTGLGGDTEESISVSLSMFEELVDDNASSALSSSLGFP